MPDHYAVIGNPVAHSRSPWIHARFALETGQDLAYEPLLASRDAFAATVAAFRTAGGLGANVTLPFKEEACALSTGLSERARVAQAVNTLIFSEAGIRGDNTDGLGLVQDLVVNLGFGIRDRRILLAGAGGAARGVLLPLLEAGPAALVIANRNVEKAQALAQGFVGVTACGYADLAGERFDLIINATSTGLSDTPLPLPAGFCLPGALAYDMVYGRDTAFMRQARADGAARTSDGTGMLVEQAAESFFLWRGVRPATASVLAALRAG